MRAREFIIESTSIVSAEKLWDYVSKIHPEDQQGGGFLKSLVMLNPQYELKRVLLSSLHIPNDEDDGNDPYGRAMHVDVDHAEEYSQYEVDKKPLVVDSQGYILDGAHRAWAAIELLNKKDIMAYVPVKTRPTDPQDLMIRKKFTKPNVTEGQSVKQEIEEFLDSLTPDDVGVEEFPGYRVHYEGFTDDCKLSGDYKRNPDIVYQQVYQDFVDREHGRTPIESNMVGDEEYPILYSIFRVKQGVAEGTEQSLSSMVSQDQSERNEYKNFVKSQAGGDWSKGAKMYAQLKKRPSNDIFGDASRLNQFMKMKFDFDKFTDEDWDNYWLLAQHCDDNRDFQKNALSIIKKYQGTDHSHYKYLYDRISMGLTGKQKYGTQNVVEQGVAEGNQFTGALAKARAEGLAEFTVGGKTFKVKNSKKIVKEAELTEKWSKKYKRSIDCSHPKGFSQKAHCAGRRKKK